MGILLGLENKGFKKSCLRYEFFKQDLMKKAHRNLQKSLNVLLVSFGSKKLPLPFIRWMKSAIVVCSWKLSTRTAEQLLHFLRNQNFSLQSVTTTKQVGHFFCFEKNRKTEKKVIFLCVRGEKKQFSLANNRLGAGKKSNSCDKTTKKPKDAEKTSFAPISTSQIQQL